MVMVAPTRRMRSRMTHPSASITMRMASETMLTLMTITMVGQMTTSTFAEPINSMLYPILPILMVTAIVMGLTQTMTTMVTMISSTTSLSTPVNGMTTTKMVPAIMLTSTTIMTDSQTRLSKIVVRIT